MEGVSKAIFGISQKSLIGGAPEGEKVCGSGNRAIMRQKLRCKLVKGDGSVTERESPIRQPYGMGYFPPFVPFCR